MQTHLDSIRASAAHFRRAIERCDPASLPSDLASFPHHSCGLTSSLLGSYLADRGFGSFEYIIGDHRDASGWYSHVWIAREKVVVDITADQFAGMDEKVIVSVDSLWHRNAHGAPDGIADFRMQDAATAEELSTVYDLILRRIDGMNRSASR